MTKKRVHMSDIIKEINAELNRIKDAKLQVFLEVFLRPKITEAIKERKNRLTFSLAELEKMLHEVGLNEAKMSLDAAFTTKKEHFEYWYSLYKSNPLAVKNFAGACRDCSGVKGLLSRNNSLKVDGPRPARLIRKICDLDHNGNPVKIEVRPLLKEEMRKVTDYWWKQYSIVDFHFDLPFRWLTLMKNSGLSASLSLFRKSFSMEHSFYYENVHLNNLIVTDYTLWEARLITIKGTNEKLSIEISWE